MKKRICMSLDVDTLEKYQALLAETFTPLSSAVNALIEQYLKEKEAE